MHLLVHVRDPERREALLGMLRSAGHHAVAAPDAPAAARSTAAPRARAQSGLRRDGAVRAQAPSRRS